MPLGGERWQGSLSTPRVPKPPDGVASSGYQDGSSQALRLLCTSLHIHHLSGTLLSDHDRGTSSQGPILCQRPSFARPPPLIAFPGPQPLKATASPSRRPVSLLLMSRAQTSSLPGLPGDMQRHWQALPLHPSQRGGGPQHQAGPQGSIAWFMGKPAARPPSRPLTVAWEEKIFQPSAQLLGFRTGRAGGHQEDLLSWGSAPCPVVRKDAGLSSPGSDHWDPRVPTKECWSSRFLGPSQWVSSCGLDLPNPQGTSGPRARELGLGELLGQLGLTQPMTLAESFPWAAYWLSFLREEAGSWEQGLSGNKQLVHLWTLRQASFVCQMEGTSCSALPKMLTTPQPPGTVFPGNLAIKCQSPSQALIAVALIKH